jgi:dienelactone hydrolase
LLLFAIVSTTTAWATPPSRERVVSDALFRCDGAVPRADGVVTVSTTLAGVPALVRVPRHVDKSPIILWHGFGPPADEAALMRALPLDQVAAIKVYLGLPLFGKRMPPGGHKELARRQAEDFAMLLFKPAVVGAADELPAVVAALRQRGCLAPGQPVGLMGFSAGGAAALVALIQGKVAISAAAIVNASTGLNASVEALERVTRQPYAWTPEARALAERTDAVRHAAQIARGEPPTAVLIVQGGHDAVLGSRTALALDHALRRYYHEEGNGARLKLMLVPEMPHGWASDQHDTARVSRAIGDWFDEYLIKRIKGSKGD